MHSKAEMLAPARHCTRAPGGRSIVIAHVEQDVVGKSGGPILATEDEIQAPRCR